MTNIHAGEIPITKEQFDQLQALYLKDIQNPDTYDNSLYIQYHTLKESWGSEVGQMGRQIREHSGAYGAYVSSYFKQMAGNRIYNEIFDTSLARAFIKADLDLMIDNYDVFKTYYLVSTKKFVQNEISMFQNDYHLPENVPGLPGKGDMLPDYLHPAATSIDVVTGNKDDYDEIWDAMSPQEKRNAEIARFRAIGDASDVDLLGAIKILAPAVAYYSRFSNEQVMIKGNEGGSISLKNPETGELMIVQVGEGGEAEIDLLAKAITYEHSDEVSRIRIVSDGVVYDYLVDSKKNLDSTTSIFGGIQELLNISKNQVWTDKIITTGDGADLFVFKRGDKLHITPKDNDFAEIKYARYDEEADNPYVTFDENGKMVANDPVEAYAEFLEQNNGSGKGFFEIVGGGLSEWTQEVGKTIDDVLRNVGEKEGGLLAYLIDDVLNIENEYSITYEQDNIVISYFDENNKVISKKIDVKDLYNNDADYIPVLESDESNKTKLNIYSLNKDDVNLREVIGEIVSFTPTSITVQDIRNLQVTYKVDDALFLDKIAEKNNYKLEDLLKISGNEDLASRYIYDKNTGLDYFLYKENEIIYTVPTDIDSEQSFEILSGKRFANYDPDSDNPNLNDLDEAKEILSNDNYKNAKSVNIWNEESKDFSTFNIIDQKQLNAISGKTNLSVDELFGIAGNQDWQDRKIIGGSGGDIYLSEEGDKLFATYEDNDFQDYKYANYDPDADNYYFSFDNKGNLGANKPSDALNNYISRGGSSTGFLKQIGQDIVDWAYEADEDFNDFLNSAGDYIDSAVDKTFSKFSYGADYISARFNQIFGADSSVSINDGYNNKFEDKVSFINDKTLSGFDNWGFSSKVPISGNEKINFSGYLEGGSGNDFLNQLDVNSFDSSKLVAHYVGNIFDGVRNHVSPLTLDLDGDGIELSHAYDQKVYFDIDNDEFVEKVGWVNADDGQLAMDVNQNGNIDNITELYGDDIMPAFEKLALHDTDNNGKISAGDEDYDNGKLLIWRDLNQNGISEEGELKTLAESGVKSISLAITETDIWDKENYISATSQYEKFDGTKHQVADVHFLNDNSNTWYKGAASQVFGSKNEINFEAILLPLSRGYGSLPSLHIAMSDNFTLKEMMKDLVNFDAGDFNNLADKITDFLYEWAGVRNNDPDARITGNGTNIDARKVDFLEKFTGTDWMQMDSTSMVGSKASVGVKKVWGEVAALITARILVQGTLKEIFPGAEYNFKTDQITLNNNMENIILRAQNYINLNNIEVEQLHEFWINIANILILQKEELGVSNAGISLAIDTAYTEGLYISDIIFTKEDGDIFSVKSEEEEYLDKFIFKGNDLDNEITGSNNNDVISGNDGNDEIEAKQGDDFILGGKGNDIILGGEGADRLEGGSGNDRLEGGAERDDLRGGEGEDRLYGGAGPDKLHGGEGADFIDGGEGEDEIDYLESDKSVYVDISKNISFGGHATGDVFINIENITGSDHSDYLKGDDNDNNINGESGDDIIYGGKGDDRLFGAGGDDQLYGEEGDDSLAGFYGKEFFDGGEGRDTVDYGHPYIKEWVYVNLKEAKGFQGAAEGDTYKDIEDVIGTNKGDVIIGDDKDNILQGMKGNDIILGGDGDDVLAGGTGVDILAGGEGRDRFIIPYYKNGIVRILDFQPGIDKIDYSSFTFSSANNYMEIVKTEENSIIHFDGKYKVLIKNILPDQLSLNDFVFKADSNIPELHLIYLIDEDEVPRFNIEGDEGDNDIQGSLLSDLIRAGKGNDSIFALEGNDIIYADEGNDIIQSGLSGDYIDGGEGSDQVHYTSSLEPVFINLSENIFKGGAAEGDVLVSVENIVGSIFDDEIIGDDGDNILSGMEGNDILNAKGGNNRLKGGEGDDIFVVDPKANQIIIEDFEFNNSNEKIDLSAFDIDKIEVIKKDFKDQTIELRISDNLIINLLNIEVGDINKENFIFKEGKIPIFEYLHLPIKQDIDEIYLGNERNETFIGYGGKDFFFTGGGDDIIYSNPTGINYYNIDYSIDSNIVINSFSRSEKNVHFIDATFMSGSAGITDPRFLYEKNIITNNGLINLTKFANIRSIGDIKIEVIGADTHLDLGGDQKVILNNFNNNYNSVIPNTVTFNNFRFNDGTIKTGLLGVVEVTKLDSSNFKFYEGVLSGDVRDNNLIGNDNIDEIDGRAGNDYIEAKGGNDIIKGGEGADIIYTGSGDDKVDAGAGNDIIYIEGGNNIITGGASKDKYMLLKKINMQDIITDFEFWREGEKIDLSAFDAGFENFAEFKSHMTQESDNVKIDLGEGQILILENVKKDYLTKDNFIGNVAINSAPTLLIKDAVMLNAVLPTTEFKYVISKSDFTDIDGDELNIEVSLANNEELPGWLHFNKDTLTISGTASVSDIDKYILKITANDGYESISYDLVFNVEGLLNASNIKQQINYVEDTIYKLKPIKITSVTENIASVTLTLSDIAAGRLEVENYENNVQSNFANGIFSAQGDIAELNNLLENLIFRPTNNASADFEIAVNIFDGVNDQINSIIEVKGEAVNDKPVTLPILHFNGIEDTPVDIILMEVFDLEDGNIIINADNIIFDNISENASVKFENGKLIYTPAENFNGRAEFTYQIKDSSGLFTDKTTIYIDIAPLNDAPTIEGELENLQAKEDVIFSYSLAEGHFLDIDNNDLTYEAKLTNGGRLPGWLTFDAENLTFSGTPSQGDRGDLEIKIIARDDDAEISSILHLNIEIGEEYLGKNIIGSDNIRESNYLTSLFNAKQDFSDIFTDLSEADRVADIRFTDTPVGGFRYSFFDNEYGVWHPWTIHNAAMPHINLHSSSLRYVELFFGESKDIIGTYVQKTYDNDETVYSGPSDIMIYSDDQRFNNEGKYINLWVNDVRVWEFRFIDWNDNGHEYIIVNHEDIGFNIYDFTNDEWELISDKKVDYYIVKDYNSDGFNDILFSIEEDGLFLFSHEYKVSGADNITGTGLDDTILGLGGDDILNGNAGTDKLYGGAGNDTLDAGAGNDILSAGTDNNILTGGDGADIFVIEARYGENQIDYITDFDESLNQDKIDLSGFKNISSIDDTEIILLENQEDQTNQVLIKILNPDNNEEFVSIILEDFTGELSNSNFIFFENNVPEQQILMPDFDLSVGELFEFNLPTDMFIDPENDKLEYSYSFEKDEANHYSGWLDFDPISGRLSGTPTQDDIGSLNLSIFVEDLPGRKIADHFSINITEDQNNVENNIIMTEADYL